MAGRNVALVFGIDLGTTNSCVAFVRHPGNPKSVEVIPNELGCYITPSYVAFRTDDETDETEILTGNAAIDQASYNPENTIFDVKRMIGRIYQDIWLQRNTQTWPFRVVSGPNKSPNVEVPLLAEKDEGKRLTPEQLSGLILQKMKTIAYDFTSEMVERSNFNAVITVPAYFNDSQKQATLDAGKIAGINVLGLLNEPTAAALAYGITTSECHGQRRKNVLVFDLGGGTFDVTIVNITNGHKFDVLAVNGDINLGGSDFDRALFEYFSGEIKLKYKYDISNDSHAVAKLRNNCAKARENLSFSTKVRICVEGIINGKIFESSLTRATFEKICDRLFQKLITPLDKVIADAKLVKEDIDEIVLAGGATRTPKLQQLLRNYFGDEKPLRKSINPDEAIARGAALYADIILRKMLNESNMRTMSGVATVSEMAAPKVESVSSDGGCLELTDVIPHSIGVGVFGGTHFVILPRNSKKPARNTERFTTTRDQQQSVDIVVFEGENEYADWNKKLGEFTMNGIQVATRGVPKIDVTFEVDINGILNVTAQEVSTSVKKTITISSNKGLLGEDDISRMIEEAKRFERLAGLDR